VVVDGAAREQGHRRVWGDECVEVRHLSVVPKEGATVEVLVEGEAYDVAGFIDAGAGAVDVAGERPEVLHAFLLGP